MSSRPFISFFLIGAFLINLVGFFAVYSTLKRIHHHHMDMQLARVIKHKRYERQAVSQAEFDQFVWRRPNKEYERNGALYDIVELSQSNDSVYIICYEDIVEKKMEIRFAKAMNVQNPDTSHSNSVSLHFMFHPFIKEPFTYSENGLSTFQQHRKDHFHYTVRLSNPHLTIHSPPPQHRFLG